MADRIMEPDTFYCALDSIRWFSGIIAFEPLILRNIAVSDESWSGNRKDIALGGRTIELHFLGMNHGLGMTVSVLPKQKVACVAAIVTPNSVMFRIVPDFNIR